MSLGLSKEAASTTERVELSLSVEVHHTTGFVFSYFEITFYYIDITEYKLLMLWSEIISEPR